MLARSLLVLLATVVGAQAAELPDVVSASKCRGKKKIFAVIDDSTSPVNPRKIKMSNSFYFQAGSVAVSACKPLKGSDQCAETFSLGLPLVPGFTGEIPCNSQSGLPYLTYSTMSETSSAYWSNTENCTVTIVKWDDEKGRLKGMYHSELIGGPGPELAAAEIVGCFSARRQDIGVGK